MFLKYILSFPSQIQVPEEYHILYETPTSENEGDILLKQQEQLT